MVEVADDLASIRALNSFQGPTCGGGVAFAGLDPGVLDKLERALADPTIQRRAVWRWLKNQGVGLSWSQFEYHVKGGCRCER
jgi:hypothetical protein